LPQFLSRAQDILEHLPESYPNLITPEQVDEMIEKARGEFLAFGENLVGYVGGTVVGVMTAVVYMVIVPLMVFFMLKDRDNITAYLKSFLPPHTELADKAWAEIHQQLRNYVGGKAIQMLIVAVVCYVAFEIIDLNFAALLAVTIAISVLIPYVGPALATLPIAIVAVLQWGFTLDTGIALATYGVIHFLDGNILVPLLFSEAVAIHPVAIIVAILFFGGVWGVWGVFFAIPLAVVVKALINAWPGRQQA
jgi:putative permease